MTNLDLITLTFCVIALLLAPFIRKSETFRSELWVSFAAAVILVLVISGGLLTLSLEMRSGWANDHEVQMDKAAAIRKLMFRP